jgi:hypothetical protein
MADDREEQKQELLRRLAETNDEAKKLEAAAHEVARSARFIQDAATPLAEVIKEVPSTQLTPEEWTRQIVGWRDVSESARQHQATVSVIKSFGPLASGVMNTSMVELGPMFIGQPASPPPSPSARTAWTSLSVTLERFPLANQADASMRRLQLDSRGSGSRTSLELLNEARTALDQGSGASGVLVTMRECIDSVLAELLRRRPRQEATPKAQDKVVSIGNQCGLATLPAAHFSRLATNIGLLRDQLSGAKQGSYSRERMMELFHSSLLFLNALLEGIDETKLR